jgi:hypothetical protein
MNPYITKITGVPVQERGPVGQAIKQAFGGGADAAPDDEGETPRGGGEGLPPGDEGLPPEGGGGEGGEGLPPEGGGGEGGEGLPPEGGGDEGLPPEGGDEGLEPWQQRLLDHVKQRFISERVNGFQSAAGTMYPPAPQEEVEQRWEQNKHKFMAVIQSPSVRARFGPDGRLAGVTGAGEGEMCPHCGQPMPAAEGGDGAGLPPEDAALGGDEGLPPEEPEQPEQQPPPEPAGENEQEEPPPERGPRLPESARRRAARKLDDE